jgi:predicted DNA-binding transcriptional regulator AlpA
MPPTRHKLIYKRELLALIGVSYGSVYNWMRQGRFPLARELGPPGGRTSRIAWLESEITEWLGSRPKRRMKPLPPRNDDNNLET